MVMGDLVLLEGEVNPVVAKLRSSGFEISAIHNHLMEENAASVVRALHGGTGPRCGIGHFAARGLVSFQKHLLRSPPAAAEEAAPPRWVKAVEGRCRTQGYVSKVQCCRTACRAAIGRHHEWK